MEKIYFLYNSKTVDKEGPSKAYLSTEAGGGSFLFTDKVESKEPIENSKHIRVVKSYTKEEYAVAIAGIEVAKNRIDPYADFDNDYSRTNYDYEKPLRGKPHPVNKMLELREKSLNENNEFDPHYERSEVLKHRG